MRQIHYRGYAMFAFGLAIIAGISMPVFWGWDVAVDLNQSSLFLILLLVAGVLLVVADVQMSWQAWRFQKARGFSSLWVAILGQSAWFILTFWMYLDPMHVSALKTVTLPITMFGIGLLMLTLSWTQRVESLAPVSSAMLQSARRLSWLSVIFAVYGFLFFGLTWDWQIGLAVATASLLVIDPRWPLIFASQSRGEAIETLTDARVKIYNPAALDQIKDIKQAVVEKTGVLTSRQLTVYNVDSIDDNYSAQDVLGIMAGLEQEVGGLYAEALVTYSHNQGVYPIQAENVEVIPLVGLQGTIQGDTYMLVSATMHYRIIMSITANG
ncbi:Copper-exporting P-type ATPase B [Weissella viridescens]|uniref:Copper-exporting P-type ATPase B n=1 Tax=Weissella viridescens TaxID=1629 RepID=A0A380NWA2_WEIVI|nr:Copper-exporting P-type ATPase B [Weissella viridescens]